MTAPICITGMHRSGTSMVAQMLHLCGLNLGPEKELSFSFASNPDGHWEHPGIRTLNDEILNEFGGGWDWPPAWPAGWATSPRLQELRSKAGEILEGFRGHDCWGWKDPRSSLTLPFWKALLPEMKFVICLRNPLEVAMSLQARGMSSYQFGLALWKAYYRCIIDATSPDERIVTHYESYFPDPTAELRRVLARLQLPVTESALASCRATVKAGLRHHGLTAQDLLDAEADREVISLYNALCREAGMNPIALDMATSGVRPLRMDRVLARRQSAEKQAYRELIKHVRVTACDLLPKDATVLVVSKGDDQLLQLNGRRTWHFPCAEDGTYLWHHPETGAEAIARLEALRGQGAQYLLLPATAFWWLEFYREFGEHLRQHYPEILRKPSCRVFALQPRDEVTHAV